MKNLIKKILKEDLSSDELNWIREVDPQENFRNWIEEKNIEDNTKFGYKNWSDRKWLNLILQTKDFVQELTEETHYLLKYVEDLNSARGIEKTKDALANIGNQLGDNDGQSYSDYVDYFRDNEKYLWDFLNSFSEYAVRYDLDLEQLLTVSQNYFEGMIELSRDDSQSLKEYNSYEKRSTTEISMDLLHQAADSIAKGLRLIESATQFAYKENNTELIEDLEELRKDIQSSGSGLFKKDGKSMDLVTRINGIIKKHS